MGQVCASKHEVNEKLQFSSSYDTSQLNSQVDFRDRYFVVPLERLPYNQSQRKQLISKWLYEVVSNSMSVAFHYLREQKMDKNSSTIFACQNIIRNIVSISYSCQISKSDIAQLNKTFAFKVLPSIKLKYPMSQKKESNMALMKQFEQIDNFESRQNDYLLSSTVEFDFRTNKKYEDLIMQFLNELIELPDRKVQKITSEKNDSQSNKSQQSNKPKQQDTIYHLFEEFMRALFQSVSDYDVMNENNKQKVNETFKNRYREEVQSYTIYHIGRKIPANVQKFNDSAIRMQQIKVKSSGILRIMTKWAEQLWRKFEDNSYFLNLIENPVLINKKMSFALSLTKKLDLQSRITNEKQQLEKLIKEIQQKNQEIQTIILNDTKNNHVFYIPDSELQEVYFSGRNLEVLENLLSKYLNLLIHSLTKVSKEFSNKFVITPLMLFPSFKIGDLIRCKCKSKETQILYIYKCLKKISQQQPKLLKIIRLKNRLEEGTRDILINVRFYELVTAEIQLAVTSNTHKYTEDCIEINHFLYELERARFGPISQLSSILYNLNQQRSLILQKAIDQSLKNRQKALISKTTFCLLHSFKPYIEPFLCDSCFKLKTSNQNVISNEYCSNCLYKECSDCRINSLTDKQLKNIVFQTNDLIENSKRYNRQNESFTTLRQGIAVYKYSRRRIITAFKIFTIDQLPTLVTRRESSPPIVHKESWDDFCSQYLIWINPTVSTEYFKEVDKAMITQQYLLSVFKTFCRKEKTKVQIQDRQMTDEYFKTQSQSKWSPQYRLKIVTLNLQLNKITDMRTVCSILPNLTQLLLDDNPITFISYPDNVNKLERLSIKRNYAKLAIDTKIKNYQTLKYMSIGWNLVNYATQYYIDDPNTNFQIPSEISIFKNLEEIHIQYNGLTRLPKQFASLKNITYLNLFGNKLKQFPKQILELTKLEKLDVGGNQLTEIPSDIKKLKLLRIFLISQNQITQIPKQIAQLNKLELWAIQSNLISAFPKELKSLQNLKKLNFSNNGFQSMDNFCTYQVEQIQANGNTISQIPIQIFQTLSNLKILSMCSNQISIVPKEIWVKSRLERLLLNGSEVSRLQYPTNKYPSLKVLQLEYNKLIEVSQKIINFSNLEELCIQKNGLTIIPNEMKHLKKLIYLTLSQKQLNQASIKVYESLKEFSWLTIISEEKPKVI